MAGYAGTLVQLNIISSGSGEVLTARFLVGQVIKQLAANLKDPWRVYTLIYGERPLSATECLGDVLAGQSTATLMAVKQPQLRIVCPALSAAFLPSLDLLVVTKGNITSLKDDEVSVLGDDAEYPVFWWWRLWRKDGWSTEEATLLARTCPIDGKSALLNTWDFQKDEKPPMPWTEEEAEEQKRTGNLKFPAELMETSHMFMRIHDESSAVFTWNQSDYFGGCALADRLDLQTGKVTRLAGPGGMWDAWDVTTDSEGHLFYTSCYDGTAVNSIDATVAKPCAERGSRILSNTVGLGFCLCYDASMKVLVATGRSSSCFVLAPPGSGAALAVQFQGAKLLESLRPPADDHTPGDRTSPWETVEVPIPEGKIVKEKGFHADNGVLTYVDQEDRVCTTDLKGTTEASVDDFDEAHTVLFVAVKDQLRAVFVSPAPG